MKRIFVNALGVNNCLGGDEQTIWRGVLSGETLHQSYSLLDGRSTVVGQVNIELPNLNLEEYQNLNCKNNQLLAQALMQIQPQVECAVEQFGRDRVGVVLGTSTSGISELDRFDSLDNLSEPYHYEQQEIGTVSRFAQMFLNLKGPAFTISTACSSSGRAFISGLRLLRSGLCDAVVVGGCDTLCDLTLNGFNSLEAVASSVCNPFSRNRQGINIGEGAAVFLLSSEASDIELIGYGESSDGYHISSPRPTGEQACEAIKAALDMGKVSPKEVGYINLHGTATHKNDEMEAQVIASIFPKETPVSSTKPIIGHCLGASAAQEIAICCMALKESLLPVHLWDQEPDVKLPQLRFAKKGDRLERPLCMSNSFAFGGNNISLLLKGGIFR